PKVAKGEFVRECDECQGSPNAHACSCGHVHDCENCGGTGEIFDTGKGMDIGSRLVALHFLWKIGQLPGALIAWDGDSPAMPFKFDGGRGIVMQLRRAGKVE